MKLIQIRKRVRGLIRDDGFPGDDIDDAINLVIEEINNSGRFRFHQNDTDLTLVEDQFQYTVSANIQDELVLVFEPQSTDQKILNAYQGGIISGINDGAFGTSKGDAPTVYAQWKDEWWLDPIPNSTAASKTVRIYYWKDVVSLTDFLDEPSIPARYHHSVIAQGAAAKLRPDTRVGSQSIGKAAEGALANMVRQELWNKFESYELQHDDRFIDMEIWGNVDTAR